MLVDRAEIFCFRSRPIERKLFDPVLCRLFLISDRAESDRPSPSLHRSRSRSYRPSSLCRSQLSCSGKLSLLIVSSLLRLLELSDKDIIEMLFLPVVNEACRILNEGIVVKASDLDIASIMGMGFPPYRGGIIFWADTLGSSYIHKRLADWTKKYGDLFKPCSYLTERAAKGSLLSASVQQLGKARL